MIDQPGFMALQPLLPELFLSVAGLLLLVWGVFKGNNATYKVIALCAVSIAAATILAVTGTDESTVKTLNNMVVNDRFSVLLKSVIGTGLVASLLLSFGALRDAYLSRFEYGLLILFSGVGMMLMVSANNLLSLYITLELQSLPLYVLAAIRRDDLKSAEAGIKYFILGALSSGLLLFGSSLIYGYTGSLDFDLIAGTLRANQDIAMTGATVGMVFILAGLCFKISAVPFHMWAPDVYDGAPMPVTALFAIVTKIAAMGLLIRVLTGPFAPLMEQWEQIIIFVALASTIWGSFAGLAQTNIKRLLAYSSIGNMGYALIGLLGGTAAGAAATLIYVTLYMAMTAGVFGIIMAVRRNGLAIEKISDFAGLSRTAPALAYAMAALMFSLSGIPPLAGFFSKLFIFQAAVQNGHYAVAVIGVLASVVGSYYYLRIIKVMFFDAGTESAAAPRLTSRGVVIAASIAITLLFIVKPDLLLALSTNAAQSLFQ